MADPQHPAPWTLDDARGHDVIERLHERCRNYYGGGVTCFEDGRAEADWCERCLAAAELAVLRAALSYIERPTMGLSGDVDPEVFARDHTDAEVARLALATCIRTAREALRRVRQP